MTRPVRLALDRLVLDGIAPRDQGAAVAAFRAELARLAASGALGTLGAGQVPARLSVQAAPARDAASAGRAAAAALVAALGGGRR